MNKRINPKYILLILVILLIIDFLTTSFGVGTWNLNRLIGWNNDYWNNETIIIPGWYPGIENLNFSLLNPLIAHAIFVIIYAFLFARKKSVLVILASLQLSIVVADIIIQSIYSYNPFYLLVISNWLLMTLVIVFAYSEKTLE